MDELTLAQERLGRTIERARASEDRELAGRVRDEGSQLVHQLNGLLRMCRLHSLDNRAFEKPLRDLAKTLERLIELLGTLTLALVEDQVYLNEIRIRLDEQGGGAELGAELQRHGLGGLRFYVPASDLELRRFVACFAAKPDPHSPRATLRAALQREGLEGIELLGRFRVRAATPEGLADGGSSGAEALKRCAQAVTDAFDNLGRGRLFNPLPARRAVAELLGSGGECHDLAVDPPGSSPHVAHALRVCRLSLLLGRELGLSHSLLQDLGVAALLHDVGYAASDRGRAPGFVRHPSAGARLLLRQRGFHLSKVRRVRAVLGHHSPAGGRRRPPSLLALLLRVVEDYDVLVRRAGLAPAEALGRMLSAAGTDYDPLLMDAFVNALGACPPGSRVTLTDGRAGVVTEPGRGARGFARPVVLVDRRADGSTPASPRRLDLAEASVGLLGVPDPPPEPAPLPLIELPSLALLDPTSELRVSEPPLSAVRASGAPHARPDSREAAVSPIVAASVPSSGVPARAPVSETPMSLEGPLLQGVPIRLIHDAHLERRSGRLTFESDAERCALHFVAGDVVAVSSSRPDHALLALLSIGGLVSQAKLDEAAEEASRTGHPLGRTLVSRGTLDQEFLEQALAAQARVLVSNLVEWDAGRYRFVPDEGPQPEEDEGHSISTDGLIVGAVRALHDPDVVRFALGDLDRSPGRSHDPGRRRAETILGAAELALLERVDGSRSARALLSESGLPAVEAQRGLLILLALGLADFTA